jgi:CelD/BcsL family acetyltransferase involved in cellulose biosynthesis
MKARKRNLMKIQQITNWEELCRLQSPWNAISGSQPMRSWDWLATWWKHYGSPDPAAAGASNQPGEHQLFVLSVYDETAASDDDAELIGIAPWFLDCTAVKGRVLRWLGSGETCTDHQSLICRPEHEDQVAAALADYLTSAGEEWDRLELDSVDAEETAVGKLVHALQDRGCLVTRHAADACWIVDLPTTWDEYLATISKSHRKQLRQLERRVLESERVRWHLVTGDIELDAAWPVLVDLHQRRRRTLGERGCFASRQFEAFHREVAQRLLAGNRLRVSWLQLDGTPAAAEYHFASASATFAYQGGVDPDRLHAEPGRLSTILCLQRAIAEGHRQFDLLRGAEPYKAHWRAMPHETCHYRILPNRRLPRLRGRVLNVTGAVSDWVRQRASRTLD